MSITERQKEIVRLIEEQGFLTVEALARLLYISPSSVRRDLTKLQEMHYLKRTHGGAGLMSKEGVLSMDARMTTGIQEKKLIAGKAAVLLRDNQTVMLDSSTTAGYLIPHLAKKKGITVFTNNLNTALAAMRSNIHTICLGGHGGEHSGCVVGGVTLQQAMQTHPDILFFSSYALNREGEITDPTAEENELRKVMIKNAKCKVFLCDSSKMNRTSVYHLAALKEIDYAVFDQEISHYHGACEIL